MIKSVLKYNGKPFKNVRSIIENNQGNIWLGSQFGLWRNNGNTFTNGIGYVYEGKDGKIWTGSVTDRGWLLSNYELKSLLKNKPIPTEINSNKGKILFGILEANDGNIWFGSVGVYRYDGNSVFDSDGKVVRDKWISQ